MTKHAAVAPGLAFLYPSWPTLRGPGRAAAVRLLSTSAPADADRDASGSRRFLSSTRRQDRPRLARPAAAAHNYSHAPPMAADAAGLLAHHVTALGPALVAAINPFRTGQTRALAGRADGKDADKDAAAVTSSRAELVLDGDTGLVASPSLFADRGSADDEPPERVELEAGLEDGKSTDLTVQPLQIMLRFVHHFDSYKLFVMLKQAGYTEQQSMTLMKLIRGLLSRRLLNAKETLVSNAELENEKYLFEAACAEMRTELRNTRTGQASLSRSDVEALNRELAILQQHYQNEIESMRDEVNMDMNEHKNHHRYNEREMEMHIQELNNKITVLLNSELRISIEKLRWQTTRRGLTAIAFIALMIITALSQRNDAAAHAGPIGDNDATKPAGKAGDAIVGDTIVS
ncbi:uncharacterized protein V1510DRAFT_430753 [Dipodascopsis tothii]|uniref:uncharacterized protein n=1 Tax=Dipodascopsis tothii TaxID=44089 RepID=UPI0034CED0F5